MQQAETAGRLVAGMRQSLRLIAAGKARRVWIAEDADERLRTTVREAAAAAGIPVEACESMRALQRRCHIAVPCAVAAEAKEESVSS